MKNGTIYDAIIVGGGHNGLVASCYLAQAGLRVLVLEKNDYLGGATCSKAIFPGIDARISVYSYLVSLLPKKILSDLGLDFTTRRRAISSFTPDEKNGRHQGLLISNISEEVTRNSFLDFTGSELEYRKYEQLKDKIGIFARKVWPTFLSPLLSKRDMANRFQTNEEREIWDYLIEKPLSALIEEHISDDVVRGIVFTDAKIGVPTFPDDPTLLQNKTFLYHIVGQGSGDWCVPVGGMGALVDALIGKARSLGVEIALSSEVISIDYETAVSCVHFVQREKELTVTTRTIMFNTASNLINSCLPGAFEEDQIEGSVFKINMLLKKLPTLKANQVSSKDGFTGTFHLNEGYEYMKTSYENACRNIQMDQIPGEMYCHSLTDPTILSPDLQASGYQTLTLFGLDVPYHWFLQDNAGKKAELTSKFMSAINYFIEEDIKDCLAVDSAGNLCIDSKSPLDLEVSLGLPKGNIFHGNLTWPFAERDGDAGTWGVETKYENVFVCGSSAKRGGAVSGIPGHNAAMKVLGIR